MAVDPRNLRPSELLMLVNSSPAGAVLSERQLSRQRLEAGYRIGDGSRIDLFRYLAWRYDETHRFSPTTSPRAAGADDPYAAHAERARARQEQQSRSARDIGEIPLPRHPRAKARAKLDLAFFCKGYFPSTFTWPFSADHRTVIRRMESSILRGGKFAVGMPRGSGKTMLAECAALWAVLFGHLEYVAIVGPDEAHAVKRLKSIKTEIEQNERLLSDFPEVCIPIRELQGVHQRKPLYRGQPVLMEFTQKQVILPNIPPNPASDGIICTAGLTGQIRGLNFKRPSDLKPCRPGLVILDDPQTDESARSPKQCQDREDIIKGTLLGLVGPGEQMAVIMPCTVIKLGDLSDRFLDPRKNPEWRGVRTPMIYEFPANEKLWDKYYEERLAGIAESDDGGERGNAFLRANWDALHEGARVSWPARIAKGDLSALQSAMNLKLEKPRLFMSEYQNQPEDQTADAAGLLTAEEIAAKTNGYDRHVVPANFQHVTAFIDVGGGCLWYAVCAWDRSFSGAVIDYGTFPAQKAPAFFKSALEYTIEDAFRDANKRGGFEAALTWALHSLLNKLHGSEWPRDDGAPMRIERCLVDYGWGDYANEVVEACRQSVYAPLIAPSHGRGIRAKENPMSMWKREPGEQPGLNWRFAKTNPQRRMRTLTFDTNFWKTALHERFATEPGDPGCLQLWGSDPEAHAQFAGHMLAERRTWVEVKAKGRAIWEWDERPERPDNDWFDCLVGCAVAASIVGCRITAPTVGPKRRRKIEVIF